MRIKRYHPVAAKDPEQLQNEVNKLIGEGWQPVGQMVVSEQATPTGDRFFQTMVQYEGEIRS